MCVCVCSGQKTCPAACGIIILAMESRNKLIADKWSLIKDIIGSPSLWPNNIRRLFWTKNLTHFQRFLLVCFCYVNGLSPEDFYEWSGLLHLCRDESARKHVESLFEKFSEGQYGDKYYAFNVSNNRFEYLNGNVRLYVPASQRT